jgi:hypothetical protein
VGLEYRNGRAYFYRSQRVGRTVRKEYVASGLVATIVDHREQIKRDPRDFAAWQKAEAYRLADEVLTCTADFNRLADRMFRAVMHLAGYARHNMGEWRRTRGVTVVSKFGEILSAASGVYSPLVPPSPLRPEDEDVLDRAARGDRSVMPRSTNS